MSAPASLAQGTPLWIVSTRTAALRPGEIVHAQLRDAVYTPDGEVLPAGTPVTGHVTQMKPDHSARVKARLRADFTPFRTPVVQFTAFDFNGRTLSLPLSPASDGTPLVSLTPPPPRKGGFIRKQIDSAKQSARDQLAVFTAPGKRDRLVQLLYAQLPWHPQRIPAGTVWTPELTADTALPVVSSAAGSPVAQANSVPSLATPAVGSSNAASGNDLATKTDDTLSVQASLDQAIASAGTPTGQAISATVLQPALDRDGNVVVPVGAHLQGVVTRGQPPRRFGRPGVLRFRFTQVSLPGQDRPGNIQTSLSGMDAPSGENLQLDSEGNGKPAPRDKVVIPLILLSLAAGPLDRDHGEGGLRKRALASNSLGAIGFLVGVAGGSPNVASGIGYWGSALSIYDRWIKHGEDIRYPRHTRFTLATSFRRGTQLPMSAPATRP